MDAVSFGAIILALLNLIVSILDDRRATRPQRERANAEKDYDRDVQRTQQAAATRDPATLTRMYEAERQSAVRRGDLDPAPPGELP